MPVATSLKDYYSILGIMKTATDDDIKAAYKVLALRWHPDRHVRNKEEVGRRFIEIHEAYKFLTDKGRREWYDKFPATGGEGKGRGRSGSVDTKKEPSAGGGLKPPAPAQRSKSDSGIRKPTSEAAEGSGSNAPKTASLRPHSYSGVPESAPVPAPSQGKSSARGKSTGRSDIKPEADPQEFIHRMSNPEKDANINSKEPSLKSRNATIYDASESDDVSMGMQLHTTTVVTTGVPSEWIFPLPLTLEELCEGTTHRYRITRHLLSGKKKKVMVDIDVAPGWKKGTKIRFAGAGNERPGGAPQAVVFVVEELPHERYTREGSVLVARVQISLYEALAGEGGSIFLTGLDGREIEVHLPLCVIKPGSEHRVEGAGMPIRKQGKVVGRGDMIIRWEIAFPDKLTKKQAKELRSALGN